MWDYLIDMNHAARVEEVLAIGRQINLPLQFSNDLASNGRIDVYTCVCERPQ